MNAVSEMVDYILTVNDWNQKQLAAAVKAAQSEVSRWLAGGPNPEPKHWEGLVHEYRKAVAKCCGCTNHEGPDDVLNFHFVCNLAKEYPKARNVQAFAALRAALIRRFVYLVGAPSGEDPFIIPLRGELAPGVDAHCFVNDPTDRRVVLILVRESASPSEKGRIMMLEQAAHVYPRPPASPGVLLATPAIGSAPASRGPAKPKAGGQT